MELRSWWPKMALQRAVSCPWAALPVLQRLQISLPILRPELLVITGHGTTECT
jgi:hypothetical protein